MFCKMLMKFFFLSAHSIMAILTYQYRVMPSKAQHQALAKILENQRQLYNAALEERIGAWKKTSISISMNDQTKSLTLIRKFDQDYGDLPYDISKWTLKRVDDAMKLFFRRCKAKAGKAGFPRFRSYNRWQSFGFHQKNGLRIKDNKLFFSGGLVGGLKIKLHRPLPQFAIIKSATFSYKLGIWRVGLSLDLPDVDPSTTYNNTIGVDVGVEYLATDSNGTHYLNCRANKSHQAQIKKAARALARCKKGSNRRRKVKLILAHAHQKLKNTRTTHLHQISKQIVKSADLIFVEDLSVSSMTKSAAGTLDNPGMNVRQKSGLNKSILDAAPSRLLSMISYKAERAGGMMIKIDPKGTSQTCPCCGTIVRKHLSERRHICSCGANMHRDHAAAVVILQKGLEEIQNNKAARGLEKLNVANCGMRASGNMDPVTAFS